MRSKMVVSGAGAFHTTILLLSLPLFNPETGKKMPLFFHYPALLRLLKAFI